jgi:hypothetical protein
VCFGGAAVYNDRLYVVGGNAYNTAAGERCVQIYDPTTNAWSYGAEAQEERLAHSLHVVDRKIYAVGGLSRYELVESIERYDPDSNEWTVFDDIPIPVSSHGADELDEQIYIFSGSETGVGNPTPAVYRFEPALGSEFMGGANPEWSVLSQARPNPFSVGTTIEFSLPYSGFVTLKILNMLGEEVATPVSEILDRGNYECRWDASSNASGVYFYRLEAGEFTETRKVILVR